MVFLTTIRQTPAYLYLKSYCLCALVPLFHLIAASKDQREPSSGTFAWEGQR